MFICIYVYMFICLYIYMYIYMLYIYVFEHNEMFYKQLRGTAIGTKMAPPYAVVFMGKLEEDFIKGQRLKPMVW